MRDKWTDEDQEKYINSLLILDQMKGILRKYPSLSFNNLIYNILSQKIDISSDDIPDDMEIYTKLQCIEHQLNIAHGKNKETGRNHKQLRKSIK